MLRVVRQNVFVIYEERVGQGKIRYECVSQGVVRRASWVMCGVIRA